MTLTQTCHACGKSRAYEYAIGDRSDLCWREACKKRRETRAAEYHARMTIHAYTGAGPIHHKIPIKASAAPIAELVDHVETAAGQWIALDLLDPIAGPAAPLADLPFALTPTIAETPSAARLQRPLNFGKD